jgi:hypothetical protein
MTHSGHWCPATAGRSERMFPVNVGFRCESGRNMLEFDLKSSVWLDPELPATYQVVEPVLAEIASVFPGPYIFIDEPFGMPDELYDAYVRHVHALFGLSASVRRQEYGNRERQGPSRTPRNRRGHEGRRASQHFLLESAESEHGHRRTAELRAPSLLEGSLLSFIETS